MKLKQNTKDKNFWHPPPQKKPQQKHKKVQRIEEKKFKYRYF